MTSQPNTIDDILHRLILGHGGIAVMRHSYESGISKSEAKAALLEAIKTVKPDIDMHPCRFNDGDCVCDCYKISQSDWEQNLINLFGSNSPEIPDSSNVSREDI